MPTQEHPLERLRRQVLEQQARYDANPSGWQPPSPHFTVQNGRVRFDHEDPMTLAQKLFVAGTLGVAGAGVGSAISGAVGAAGAGGGAAAATAPTAATVAGGGAAGAGAAAAGAGGGMAGTLSTIGQWAPIVSAGLGAVNSFRGSGDPPYSAEMEQLLRLQRQRAEAANPLYQAVLQMAMGLMPTAARAGMMQGGAPAMAPASVHGGRRG